MHQRKKMSRSVINWPCPIVDIAQGSAGIVLGMAITHMDSQPPLSREVAARIRAALALRGMTHADLAAALSKPPLWVSRRIGPKNARSVSLNLDELELIAAALRIPVHVLFGIGRDELPHLDSNQEPAG